jgi:hypothetical protein
MHLLLHPLLTFGGLTQVLRPCYQTTGLASLPVLFKVDVPYTPALKNSRGDMLTVVNFKECVCVADSEATAVAAISALQSAHLGSLPIMSKLTQAKSDRVSANTQLVIARSGLKKKGLSKAESQQRQQKCVEAEQAHCKAVQAVDELTQQLL